MWITRFLKFCYMGSTKDAVFSVSLSLYISTMLIVSFLWSMKGSVTSFGQCVYCRFVLSISLLKFIQATVKQLPVLQWAYNYYSINDFYFLYLYIFSFTQTQAKGSTSKTRYSAGSHLSHCLLLMVQEMLETYNRCNLNTCHRNISWSLDNLRSTAFTFLYIRRYRFWNPFLFHYSLSLRVSSSFRSFLSLVFS